MATQDREPVQPSAHVPAGPRTAPRQMPQQSAGKLKIGLAGREAARQSPPRNLNGK